MNKLLIESVIVCLVIVVSLGAIATQPQSMNGTASARDTSHSDGQCRVNHTIRDVERKNEVLRSLAAIITESTSAIKELQRSDNTTERDLRLRYTDTLEDVRALHKSAPESAELYFLLVDAYLSGSLAALGTRDEWLVAGSLLEREVQESHCDKYPSWLMLLARKHLCSLLAMPTDGSTASSAQTLLTSLACSAKLHDWEEFEPPNVNTDDGFRAVVLASDDGILLRGPIRTGLLLDDAGTYWALGTYISGGSATEKAGYRRRALELYMRVISDKTRSTIVVFAEGSECMELHRKLQKLGKSIDDPTLILNEDKIDDLLRFDDSR